ncbi:MAG: hypothetical protein AAF391_00235 [Bacteroidota bacterium]
MNKFSVLFLILVSFSGYSQNYSNVKVGPDEKISLQIPDSFFNMNDQDRMKQVYSTKVPLAMFANETQEATLGINYNIMQWTQEDTELLYGFYKSSVNNLFDDIEFIQDEIKTINGREFIVFEFVGSIENDNQFSTKAAQKNYTYIQYTSWNDQVLLFNFSCKARLKNQWEVIAKEVMGSIKIKK